MKAKLSILTVNKVSPQKNCCVPTIFNSLCRIMNKRHALTGPESVLNYLAVGLRKLKIPYNINPDMQHMADNCIVLSGANLLKIAIQAKQQGIVKHILAGPNMVVLPDEENGIILNQKIDRIIVPSSWVSEIYVQQATSLAKRIRIWASGVDDDEWKLTSHKDEYFLIYVKTRNQGIVNDVVQTLNDEGLLYKLTKYGEYDPLEYKDQLKKVIAVIYLTESESQGISQLETWSANIPTLVWNPGMSFYKEQCFTHADSSPYLTPQTGRKWQTVSELKAIITSMAQGHIKFEPRKWVLSNQTSIISAQNLMEIFKAI